LYQVFSDFLVLWGTTIGKNRWVCATPLQVHPGRLGISCTPYKCVSFREALGLLWDVLINCGSKIRMEKNTILG